MGKIGYIYHLCTEEYIEEQFKALSQEVEYILEEETIPFNQVQDEVLMEIVSMLKPGNQLLIYELRCLGKSIVQLGDFLEELNKKEIELVVLNKGITENGISDKMFMDVVSSLAYTEKSIARERTRKGILKARGKGRVGGRPKISEETINRIQYLHEYRNYTLRNIAEECEISLSTVYKYVQKNNYS